MSNEQLPMSVMLYITNKYLDGIIGGSRNGELDIHLILAMCCAYRQNFDVIIGKSENEHQALSNQVFKFILDQVETTKKLPAMGGIENQLVVLMAKAFRRELEKINVNNKYSLKF